MLKASGRFAVLAFLALTLLLAQQLNAANFPIAVACSPNPEASGAYTTCTAATDTSTLSAGTLVYFTPYSGASGAFYGGVNTCTTSSSGSCSVQYTVGGSGGTSTLQAEGGVFVAYTTITFNGRTCSSQGGICTSSSACEADSGQQVSSSDCSQTCCVISSPQSPPSPSPGGSGSGTCNNSCSLETSTPQSGCSSSIAICTSGNCPASTTVTCNAQETLTTNYNAGGGISESSTATGSAASPAGSVNASNGASVPWLLTCPLSPDQVNSKNQNIGTIDQSLFYSYPDSGQYQFVAGDPCLNNGLPLQSTLTLPTQITWNTTQAANATVMPLRQQNLSALTINDFGYSPMLEGGGDAIANGFSTNTNIFGQVPSYAQHGVWSWNAKYANLSSYQKDTVTATAEPLITQVWDVPVSSDNDITENGASTALSSGGVAANGSAALNTSLPRFVRTGTSTTVSSTSSSTSTSTSTSTTSPTSTLETYTCQYQYNYSETTSLQSVSNYYVPYTAANQPAGSTSIGTAQFNANVVPYFTYNYFMQAPDGQQMADSYDLFSPWYYQIPNNNTDPLPLDTFGDFLANYNGNLISSPTGTGGALGSIGQILQNIDKMILQGKTNLQGLLNALAHHGGQLYNPQVPAPMSIAALPNDFIFVLNQSGSTYYLNVLRLVPRGYYNTSTYLPTPQTVLGGQQTTSSASWSTDWNNYWANVISLQSQSTYDINKVSLNGFFSSFLAYMLGHCTAKKGCIAWRGATFTPMNISVADDGSVFVTGQIHEGGTYYPGIIKLSFPQDSNGFILWGSSPTMSAHVTYDFAVNSSAPVLSEIAATPTGQIVFGANQSSGYLYQFSGNDLSQQGTISLAYQTSITSGEQATLNVAQWLWQGGLDGVRFDCSSGGAQCATPYVAFNVLQYPSHASDTGQIAWNANDLDVAANHHPLGLYDVNGYLYVLDNWGGSIGVEHTCPGGLGCQNSYTGTFFDMLVLRALNSTGANAPISPSHFNDMFTQSSCGVPQAGLCVQEPVGSPETSCFQCSSAETPICGTGCVAQATQPCAQNTNGQGYQGTSYQCVSASTGQAGTYYSLATGNYGSGQVYPPYGWILSANVTPMTLKQWQELGLYGTAYYSKELGVVNGSATANPASTTFCANYGSGAGCLWNPSNLPDGALAYPPIGPAIDAVQTGSGSDAFGNTGNGAYQWPSNGTGSGFAPRYSAGFTVNFNQTADIIFNTYHLHNYNCPTFGACDLYSPNTYNDLITAGAQIENYTKILGGYAPYACFMDTSLPGVCTYLSEVSGLAAPVYTVDNPFKYIENLGSASTLTSTGQFYSSYLPGLQSGSSTSSYKAGPPSLSIQSSPVGWGQSDRITATASSTSNTVQITIQNSSGTQVASSQAGVGTAVYYICSSSPPNPVGCLSPANGYEINATETGQNGSTVATTTSTLDVQDIPFISLQSQVFVLGTEDAVYAQLPPNETGAITITVDNGGTQMCTSGPSPSSGNSTSFTIDSQTCPSLTSLSPPASYNVTATSGYNGKSSSVQLFVAPAAGSATSTPTSGTGQSLTSQISGSLIVPYRYTYSISQTWGNPVPYGGKNPAGSGVIKVVDSEDYGNGCPTSGVFSTQGSSSQSSETVYSYSLVNSQSNQIGSALEGGATYLANESTGLPAGYFIPNLSDFGLVVPPQILYNIQNDRLFGIVYSNLTTGCTGSGTGGAINCASNRQAVIGYNSLYTYQVNSYRQAGGGGYSTFGTVSTPASGASQLPGGTPISPSGVASFSYDVLQNPTTVSLFEIYQQAVYDSGLALNINRQGYSVTGGSQFPASAYSGQLYGYNRLIYVFTDRFGNRIYAPIDADIANTISVSLNVDTSVSQGNANQTTVNVIGTAGTYYNLGTSFAPLANNDIYLYYDTNLDYLNYNPQSLDPAVAQNAIFCAYSANSSDVNAQNCRLYNPVSGRQAPYDLYTYAPSYNSLGVCSPPPNSLLQSSITRCNIYGSYNLGYSCPNTGVLQTCADKLNTPGTQTQYSDLQQCLNNFGYSYCAQQSEYDSLGFSASCLAQRPASSNSQYCMPIYLNGTGECTSQLGLFAIAKTNANGEFNASIQACGSRADSITASFYGYPSPQPVQATVVPLAFAANSVYPHFAGSGITVNELNYYDAPANATSATFHIGLFELTYGNLDPAEVLVGMAMALLLGWAIEKRGMQRDTKKGARRRR